MAHSASSWILHLASACLCLQPHVASVHGQEAKTRLDMFRNFHTLTPDNVEGALVETSSLVVFQKDGCAACADLALSWNEWREHLPAAVKFYVANCTMYREFGHRFKLQGYPTIILFHEARMHKYHLAWDQTAEKLLRFVDAVVSGGSILDTQLARHGSVEAHGAPLPERLHWLISFAWYVERGLPRAQPRFLDDPPFPWYRELARNEEYNTIWRDLNNSHTAGWLRWYVFYYPAMGVAALALLCCRCSGPRRQTKWSKGKDRSSRKQAWNVLPGTYIKEN